MATNRSKKKKPDDSPDKTDKILNKAMDLCGKCSEKCSSKRESIQCDLCGLCTHASCRDISKNQYKAIKSLSGLDSVVHYCHNNDCRSHIKYITSEWVKSQDTTKVDEIVTNLMQQHISK